MILFHLLIVLLPSTLLALLPFPEKVSYTFTNEPIDVVIPSTEKDLPTLERCIRGIKSNCHEVRRVIVVSKKKLTDRAEWFSEDSYPFSKLEIAHAIYGSLEEAKKFINAKNTRIGWIFQQLIKFYAPFVISNISSNVLILDSDTIFLNPVEFTNSSGEPLYNVGTEYHKPYFAHMARLLVGLRKVFPEHSGICHHMLFQKPVLEDLFQLIENQDRMPAWQAICRCIDRREIYNSCMSEYEIYFNFMMMRSDQGKIRQLKWTNSADLKKISDFKARGFHYASFHAYLRDK